MLESLGREDAQVSIHDEGALPFVIAARIETAARRSGRRRTTARFSPTSSRCPSPSAQDRLRRSRLYLPGIEPKYFINAALHGPTPSSSISRIRFILRKRTLPASLVRNALRAVDFGACERMVRINQLPLGLEDLAEIIPEAPDLILIPKVEHPGAGRRDRPHDREIEARHTASTRPIWLMPILESALGIENAVGDCGRQPATSSRITIGLEDYTADLGVAKTPKAASRLRPHAAGECRACCRRPGHRFGLRRRGRHGGPEALG